MKRELFLDISQGAVRAAVVEDGVLSEIHCERDSETKLTDSLFLGRVQSVRPSVCAAFVDIGRELNAFLPLEEGEQLRCGEMILVQGAARQATDTKGLRVTRRINLAGRWLVLVPDGSGVRISKKIRDPDFRRELTQAGEAICPPGCALIVRTASEGMTAELLEDEARALDETWRLILQKAAGQTRPGVVYEQERLHMRLARDLRELSRIVVNDMPAWNALRKAQSEQRLSMDTALEYFEEKDRLVYDAFQLEKQIEKALNRRVWLPCGGYLIIDSCEAMTVIDVNSGKMTLGRGIEDTALRVNLEAADEIARQLRLRDVGGMVVVDFIDMRDCENRERLKARMRQATAADRSPVKVIDFTRLGLMELTRRRANAELRKQMRVGCSYCAGVGEVLAPGEVAMRALRQVRRMALGGQRGPFVVRCAPAAAQELAALPSGMDAPVYALGTAGRHVEKFDIEQIGADVPPPQGAKALDKRAIEE
ncbi:MAG: Rne/Rng family ribonuclease [Clostridia bacterium]|nr:Rne/Rng family ribonuclease [Clostridia bacterium]